MVDLNSEDLFLNRAKFVMKLHGVWMPSAQESLFSKVYRIFMMSLQYLFLFFQIIHLVVIWGDLELLFQSLNLLFTQACLCLKVTVFQLNMNMLRDLLERMNSEVFKPQSELHKKILSSQAVRIKRLLLGFMIMSQTTCGLWALKPLFDDAGGRNFPFEMWMPVSPQSSPSYELGYAFQLITICMSAYMYFGVDSVVLSMVIFGYAQTEILKDKIKSLDVKGRENRKKIGMENYDKLIECVKHHQAIVSLVELVEDAYHTYLLFQLTGCVGLICISALRLLVVDWRSMQFFSTVTYLLGMISQLYVCCWCGDELSATSEDLHTVLHMCPWYEQDVLFRRTLHVMLLRARRPMVLRAGHYVTLSRQTFVAILRMSYSYFAVLNQAM